MALTLKLPTRFPICAPSTDPNPNPNSNPNHHSTELRFSRWNNANAEKFNERRRTQQEIEDEIRRARRFDSATKITNTATIAAAAAAVETFKSFGTPSSPSRPSIPGKKSKYSKPPPPPEPSLDSRIHNSKDATANSNPRFPPGPANVKFGDDGASYVIDGAPFEFRYSYTETPAPKPIRLREPPFAPFGPATMARPWTGRTPKPVKSPDPVLTGSGFAHVRTREEVLGEPLTKVEIDDLVKDTMKTTRQHYIGRDGLTHNMLENIHAHWKWRKVCKIKCKGVCTVDMDNVCKQLEERTGGKIIYRKGGTVFLFRGRNYNYRMHPRFPLMLWKPVPPVYPRLIKRVPEGLTLEKATEMRQKGRNLIPICKLGKNGVYCDLIANVREAFEECELVRINCQGLNESDYRRIGSKLRDLVPCALLSFEDEHILMWRGPNWRSSLPSLRVDCNEGDKTDADSDNSYKPPSDAQEISAPCIRKNSVEHRSNESDDISIISSTSVVSLRKVEVLSPAENSNLPTPVVTDAASLPMRIYEVETTDDVTGSFGKPPPLGSPSPSVTMLGTNENSSNGMIDPSTDKLRDASGAADVSGPSRSCTEGLLLLLEQAVEEGSALVLDDKSSDADNVYQASVVFAKSAPRGPVFKLPRKVMVQKSYKQQDSTSETKENTDKQEDSTFETKENIPVTIKSKMEKAQKMSKIGRQDSGGRRLHVVPQGRVDKLEKLLT